MNPEVSLGLSGVFIHEFSTLFSWWLGLFLVGLLFAPICAKLFQDWPDRGYPFAKPLGLLLGGYTCWLLASLRLVPFGRASVIATVVAWGAVSLATAEARSFLLDLVWKKPRLLLTREIGFIGLLLFWAFIRGQNPDILGLEKFMDFGFVNACLRSPAMPPPDPWFAGETINYYYFGHFITAWLIKLTNVAPDYGYNLAIESLFALTFTLSFSFVAALAEAAFGSDHRLARNCAGLVGALLAACSGNSHAFWKWFLPLIGLPFAASKSFYFPDSTRFIGYDPPIDDKTIHEFPLYSFIVSDLHGHVSDLPFVLLFLGLLFAGWRRFRGSFVSIPLWPYFPLFALSLAVFSMTNMWDVPIYLLLAGFAVIFSCSSEALNMPLSWSEWGKRMATRSAVILLGFPLLALPFTRSFKNFSQGVGFTFTHTSLVQFLTLWGGHLLFAIIFLCWFFGCGEDRHNPWLRFRKASAADRFCLAMIATGICLLAIPEIVYVKDIYGRTFHRANTMFKLTYQAFLLLSLVGGFVFERVPRGVERPVLIWINRCFLIGISAALLLYAIPSVPQFYGGISRERYAGQEGLRFLNRGRPGDFLAVKWLQDNILGQPAILEANGDSYTDFGRISMATGLPTPLGWFVHEWLWRGNADPASARSLDVERMYQSGNLQMVQILLRKYGVRYIIVGDLERQKFSHLHLDLFQANFREIFNSAGTRIFLNQNQ
ncbi:MAG: DUF2298 domain-containing protein [Candidatus Ozemobacteraceae bacterium]